MWSYWWQNKIENIVGALHNWQNGSQINIAEDYEEFENCSDVDY